jgi:hypothetical protein
VFLLSLNNADRDCKHCVALLDVGSAKWQICLSEITKAESSIGEYLEQLEKECALQGVVWRVISMAEISTAQRTMRAFKKSLEKAAMASRDIKQVVAASCAGAELLVTRDSDFWAPAVKRKNGAKAVVKEEIARLSIEVVAPSGAIERLKAELKELEKSE